MALAKQVGGMSACFNTSLRLQPGAKLPTRNRPWLLEPLIQRYGSALFHSQHFRLENAAPSQSPCVRSHLGLLPNQPLNPKLRSRSQ
jgi:hypothetical protein